jgi:hypothetical protein
MVVGVGYCFDIYADFAGSSKNLFYFPDSRSLRRSRPNGRSRSAPRNPIAVCNVSQLDDGRFCRTQVG